MDFTAEFSVKLKEKKYRSKDIADILNVSVDTVKSWRTGRRVPNNFVSEMVLSILEDLPPKPQKPRDKPRDKPKDKPIE